MSEEINCMNCSIGDFKHQLCDTCHDGFCKEFKSIGKSEDFINAVMQRIRPQGEWVCHEGGWIDLDYYPTKYECDQCHHYVVSASDKNYCPNCGAKMKQ